MYIHRTSTGKFKIDQPVTVIDWASVPSLLTVSYNRMFLVDQEGPFTLGLAKKVVPAGGLMRPSAVLSWQQRISFAAYNNFRLTVMTFPNVIPKISKKKKLKVLKCQPGWTFFDKRCYKILEEPRNGDAFSMEVACTSLPGRNARLTSIGSLDEHDFLYDMAPPNSNTWVGSVYTLPTVNGVMVQPDLGWFWTDLKTPWNFTYWAEGEPGNDGGSTLCLALRKTDEAEQKNNGWVAMDCMNKNYGICRKAAKKKTAKPTKPPTPYPTLSPSPEPTPMDTTTGGSGTGIATGTETGTESGTSESFSDFCDALRARASQCPPVQFARSHDSCSFVYVRCRCVSSHQVLLGRRQQGQAPQGQSALERQPGTVDGGRTGLGGGPPRHQRQGGVALPRRPQARGR